MIHPQKAYVKGASSINKTNEGLRSSSDTTRSSSNGPMHLNSAPNTTIPSQLNTTPLSNATPPPIAPRPQVATSNRTPMTPSYNAMLPMSRFGMTPGYGAFGGYGYPARYGYPSLYGMGEMGEFENAFLRMAEESSRPAFQSIESLVTAVGSISMMLESTYHAVYSSYRAILGVVESFSRLRNHLAHVLSTLALIRTFQWLVQKMLYLLRLRAVNPSIEAAWASATTGNSQIVEDPTSFNSSWPFVVFLGVIFGAPWLIYRIFSKVAVTKLEKGGPSKEEVFHAIALYEFRATHTGELNLRPGQLYTVAPKSQQSKTKGWVMVISANQARGLVPSNYLRYFRTAPKQGSSKGALTVTPAEPVKKADEPNEQQMEAIFVDATEVNAGKG